MAEDPLLSSVTATIEIGEHHHRQRRPGHASESADFLDVERYPTLEYRSTGIKWQGNEDPIFQWARLRNHRLGGRGRVHIVPPQSDTPGRFVLTGELTVKGITRAVDLEVNFGGARRDPYGQNIFGFSATAEINREDYGLLWNVMLRAAECWSARRCRSRSPARPSTRPDPPHPRHDAACSGTRAWRG